VPLSTFSEDYYVDRVKTTLAHIAQWVADFDPGAVAPESIERIKHSILDAIGCAYVTLEEDCVRGVLALSRETGGSPQATLIGGGTAPLATATLVNGTLIRAIDFNDHLALDPNDGTKLGGHPSDNLAAILAAAEWRDCSGKDVITAALIGYELYGRLYKFLTPELPWDHTTAFGLTVPAVVARLLGLNAEQIAHAIAISAAQCATLGVVRRGQLSHAKFLASALVTQRGVQAAQLAAAGVRGPMTVFEDSRGLAKGIFQCSDGLEHLYAPLGRRHMVEGVTIKAFPGMDTTQAATQAAIAVRGGRALKASDVAEVELILNDHPMILAQTGDAERRQPKSRETADHSFQYLVAVALLDGELTPSQFADGRWFSPDVVDLMNRMVIRSDPGWKARAPGGFPCTVRLKTNDGRESRSEIAYANGHARNKMDKAQVIAKFKSCVHGRLTTGQADAIVSTVYDLEALPSARDLARLLAQPGS
jgi:2-methylcitrate dehydratase